MDIRLVKNADLNFEKWDQTVNSATFPLIYANSWYLDMISYEWDALVYGDYETVMPLPHKKKFGIPYVFRPYGAQQLGIFGKGSNSPEVNEAFLKSIPKHYKWMDLYLNEQNVPDSKLFNISSQCNLVVDLSKSYEEIYNGYSKRTRRNLRKSKQYRFNQFEYDNPEMLIRLFKENKGKELRGLKEEHYSKMLHIMHVLLHRNAGFMWNLYTEPNSLCAGVFFAKWKGRIYFLFSATNEEGREKHAITKILDEFFIHHSGKDLLFDFEGTNIPGLQEFYRGFGAVEANYYNVRINRLGIPVRLVQRIIG